jgi:hypothetical protein
MNVLSENEVYTVAGGVMIGPSEETQAGIIGGFIGGMMGSIFGGIGSMVGAFVGSEVGMYAADNAQYIVEHSGDMSQCPVCYGATP